MTTINDIARHAAGLSTGGYYLHSGSVMQPHSLDAIDIDGLWDRMYVNPKPVIIACVYCQAHNAMTNPCCVQCGAPMGASNRR